MKHSDFKKKKRRKLININIQGGLMKRKAEKDRLIFFRSTRNRIFRVCIIFYRGMGIGIDSS